ncbi:cell division protein ZapA [Wolbachia endosymbiont of Chironomus riparius]|uniref:cell division protein ZapA n=1 Tax=Wolbachia endosymbiont of Chironomus riparius TaxID=2883238 RepID=UPI0020A0EF29|nr:cell division protein ZapA [Wolbachia endosymbiont of Chironomus riparius]
MEQMEKVKIFIRGKDYNISCGIGEQDHLLYLANRFNKLVNSISNKTGSKGSDSLNFLLAALMLEDQILELTRQLNQVNQEYEKYKSNKKIEYTEMSNRISKVITNLEYMKEQSN